MKLKKTVDLGDYKVEVLECTIGQMRNILQMMASAAPKLKSAEENPLDMLGTFNQALSTLFEQLTDVIIFPAGKTLNDLTLSEAELVWEAVTALNPKIFKKKGMEGIPEAITKVLKGPPMP